MLPFAACEVLVMESVFCNVNYPARERVLTNGETVTFKLLGKSDEVALRSFFMQIPAQEVETLKHNVHDPEIISHWIVGLDYLHVIPIVAWNESSDAIVCVGTLNRMRGPYRHISEIRVVVGQSHRKLGMGSILVKELIGLATEHGLHYLRADILTDNLLAIKAFRQLGFEQKCVLEGCFMTHKGKTRDVTILLKRLRASMEEDLFYVF
jgi:L-amino acid N-acyltransferase YncA